MGFDERGGSEPAPPYLRLLLGLMDHLGVGSRGGELNRYQ